MNMVANTIQGILPSLRVPTGQTATVVVSAFPPLDPTIWAETALAYIPTNVLEPWPSAAPEWAIMRRLTNCLGSNGFTRVLTLAMERFNGMKGSVSSHRLSYFSSFLSCTRILIHSIGMGV